MAGYQKPGIVVTEVDTPNTTIVLDQPTVVGLVGKARGNQVLSQVVQLVDNDPVTLDGLYIETAPADGFTVRDMNLLNTVYVQGASDDYVVEQNSGVTTIKRNLNTSMTSTEQVVCVTKTTSPSGVTLNNVQFNYNNTTNTISPSNGGNVATTGGSPGNTDVSIQRAGAYALTTDYTVNSSNGRVARANAAYGPGSTDCHIMNGQTVYVTYTTNSGENTYVDENVTLSGTTQSALVNESEGVDIGSIVVRNMQGMTDSTSVIVFSAGVNSSSNTDVDFEFTFSPNVGAATSYTMTRNTHLPNNSLMETNTYAVNRADVRVDYTYIPPDYYYPTIFTSFQEFENKYGSAFNANGTVSSPLSAAAYMCFRSGSNSIIAQALFTQNEDGTRVEGTESTVSHWESTLESLRGQTAINVVVPVVGQNELINNSTIAAIQSAVVSHINYMNQDNEFVIALMGEDSTSTTAAASNLPTMTTLREHAQVLNQQALSERTVLVSPASFKFTNPVTGKASNIGGQYIAASIAGILARDPVQSSLTRKAVVGITDVNIYRNETEKNADAGYGLMVVENKNGVVRVRHAITTAIGDDTKRELNAMRSKFFMIESIRSSLDENIIGRIINDNRAPFVVSTAVEGVLDFLRSTGAITAYSNVSATRSSTSATSMTVRFNYSLPYAVNNIEIVLAIDSTTGNITAQ